jgi:hypothetical protein
VQGDAVPAFGDQQVARRVRADTRFLRSAQLSTAAALRLRSFPSGSQQMLNSPLEGFRSVAKEQRAGRGDGQSQLLLTSFSHASIQTRLTHN